MSNMWTIPGRGDKSALVLLFVQLLLVGARHKPGLDASYYIFNEVGSNALREIPSPDYNSLEYDFYAYKGTSPQPVPGGYRAQNPVPGAYGEKPRKLGKTGSKTSSWEDHHGLSSQIALPFRRHVPWGSYRDQSQTTLPEAEGQPQWTLETERSQPPSGAASAQLQIDRQQGDTSLGQIWDPAAHGNAANDGQSPVFGWQEPAVTVDGGQGQAADTTAAEEPTERDAKERSLSNATATFLTSSSTVFRFIIINILQLIFNSVGWFFTSVFWTPSRAGAVSADPDLAGAFSFILDPQTAANNIAIATGYWLCTSIVWIILGFLGAARTTNTGRAAGWDVANLDGDEAISQLTDDSSRFSLAGEVERSQISLTGSEAVAALDSQFSFSGTTKWFLVNLVFTLGPLLFWGLMSLLPKNSSVSFGRSSDNSWLDELPRWWSDLSSRQSADQWPEVASRHRADQWPEATSRRLNLSHIGFSHSLSDK